MHPLIRAGVVSALFVAVGSRAAGGGGAGPSPGARPGAAPRDGADDPSATAGMSAVCPPGTLPDADACVPIPPRDDSGGEELAALPASHHDKNGRFETYDQIPRRPDRPAAYDAYRYPVPLPDQGPISMSGYD